MIPKRLEDISKEDIEYLVTERIGESKALEYKSELPKNGDADKKEALRDIASFANASGGDLIYGIRETAKGDDKGRAEAVVPILGTSADDAMLRLEHMIQNGLAPTLRVQMKEIEDFNGAGTGFVLVVRIPQSLSAPHMVTLGDSYRFYSRTSSGKFPMKDVGEIRSAFLATESQGERVRNFIRERLGRIVAGETPVPMEDGPRVVLHVIPLTEFLNARRFDLTDSAKCNWIHSAARGSYSPRYNLEGILRHSWEQQARTSYAQLYFDGCVEVVDSFAFFRDSNSIMSIPSLDFEHEMIQNVKGIFEGYKEISAAPPAVVAMSFVGCRKTALHVNIQPGLRSRTHGMDRYVRCKLDGEWRQ
ncbi:MAG: ATP-binding protein [Candidatus Hydrogenedentes bacterium]|nr:ATP-binding protein [Candidatus Hydrogenedentota bacterium]